MYIDPSSDPSNIYRKIASPTNYGLMKEIFGNDFMAEAPTESVELSKSRGKKKAEAAGAEKTATGKKAPEKTAEGSSTEAKAQAELPREKKAPPSGGNIATLSVIEGEGMVASSAYKQGRTSDQYLLRDGFDESRDITGVKAEEGKPGEPFRFTIDLAKLRDNAEQGNLDMYLLISLGNKGKVELPDGIPGITSKPWTLAVGGYDADHFSIYDEKGQVDGKYLKEMKFNKEKSAVEFSLDKEALRSHGWKDGDPVQLQPFTARDFVKKIIDSLDEAGQKPWDTGKLQAFLDTAGGAESAPPPAAGPAAEPSAERKPIDTWKNDLIYFLLTDRFRDGDTTNNQDVVPTDMKKYHGGDIQGIIDKLDYIKDIGATSIWLTPVMTNQTHFFDTDSYHGYWPIDFYNTDKHVGDMAKFQELIDKAHEKGMKIILDIPLNHTAWEHPLYKDPKTHDWFHHIGDVKDWEDPYWAENGSIFGLPDLAQENPAVEKYLTDIAKFWIDKGIDGFRLDAVKNVPLSFWAKFDRAIHDYAGKDFLLVGEYFDGNPAKVAKYQREDMDSLFDYPLYWTLKDTFAKDGSMRGLADKMAACEREYPNPGVMSVFLDNHDTPRFLTEAGGDKNKLKLALAFAMTVNRIPTIYYGTETAMEGNCDIMGAVDNRKDMQWDNDPAMREYFRTLAVSRKNNVALREGKLLEMWQDDKVYAYSRLHPDQEAVVILNNDYGTQQREIPLRGESALKNGTVMQDLLTGEKVTIQGGKIRTEVAGKHARVFVPVK
ncbi:MAG: alpha-amylase family glycosyl hydrolase [Candidatus Eremiobacteraeota bacterium]|nr:alpha-amylase family glycosyl hydrolase [Candidatus Eremiobacteraeota bacterium]